MNNVTISIDIIDGVANIKFTPLDNADAADAAAFAIENVDSRFRQKTVHNMVRFFGRRMPSFHYAWMAELIVAKYHAWGYSEVHGKPLTIDTAKRIISQDSIREGKTAKVGRGWHRIQMI